MTVKLTYTGPEFGVYLHDLIRGRMAQYLNWDPDRGDYDQILEDTLISMGLEDIATIQTLEGVRRLRILGQVHLWTHVLAALSIEMDHSADGASFTRSKLFDQAQALLNKAETAAISYGYGYVVSTASVTRSDDPYVWPTTEEVQA